MNYFLGSQVAEKEKQARNEREANASYIMNANQKDEKVKAKIVIEE